MFQEQEAVRAEEAEWYAEVRNGNTEFFTKFIERYERAVFNLCYRMLGNPGDAEDAAQESFFRAYRAIDRYDPSRKFSTWVLSIASNFCIDQLRKRRFLTLSLDGNPYLDVSDLKPGPEASLFNKERERTVRDLLGHLSETDRAAVIMRYWYEFSYDEIAEALSLTNSAIKSRLHRARLALAQAWETENAQTAQLQNLPYEAPAY